MRVILDFSPFFRKLEVANQSVHGCGINRIIRVGSQLITLNTVPSRRYGRLKRPTDACLRLAYCGAAEGL